MAQAFDDQTREVQRLLAELDSAQHSRTAAEQQFEAGQQLADRYIAQVADRRETVARFEGDVRAASSRVDARTAEIARLGEQIDHARQRLALATEELEQFAGADDGLDDTTRGLVANHEAAVQLRDEAESALGVSRTQQNEAQRDLAGLDARIEALAMRMDSAGGAHALADFGATLGTVADLVRIEAGYEQAIAAALASSADAVAVADVAQAVAALQHLRQSEAGRTSIVIGAPGGHSAQALELGLPSGTVSALDVVQCAHSIEHAIRRVLRNVVIVDNLDGAQYVISAQPDLTVVTRDGDTLSATSATGGSADAGRIQIAAALEQAQSQRAQVLDSCHRLDEAVQVSVGQLESRVSALAQIAEQLELSQASLTQRTQQIALLESQRAATDEECGRLSRALIAAQQGLEADNQAVIAAQQQLANINSSESDLEAGPDAAQLDEWREAVGAARQRELESRLALRTGEERATSFKARIDELTAAAEAEREARIRARELREQRERQALVAIAVLAVAEGAAARLESTLAESEQARFTVDSARTKREAELTEIRSLARELAATLEQLTSAVHSDEVARAEQRMRVEQIETKALEEFGVDSESLLAEYSPDVLVPPSGIAVGDEVDPEAPAAQPYPFVREEQEKRLSTAEKSMALLGRVNPLALEEFTAMEERHAFLTTQLEDLKQSRKDLLDIVADVDERVQQVFSEAFVDVQEQFADVFSRLFPGGEGRLVLTDPTDLLNTGIEVEARPAGKKVKRLSLLSGGERSLTAVAFLISLFKARPSPFYLLDEVEAALDDTNLGRLLVILEELRASSQLLVITHQKRTMEIGDALYGITMRDGVTAVISQRLRELQNV